MISRRAVLGTGAGVAVAAGTLATLDLTHRLDDVADAVGIDPHPEPAASDVRLVRRVAASQAGLLAQLTAVVAAHPDAADDLAPWVEVLTAQAESVGAPRGTAPPAAGDRRAAVTQAADACAAAADERATDAVAAVAPELARVLASMAAGLDRCRHGLEDVA